MTQEYLAQEVIKEMKAKIKFWKIAFAIAIIAFLVSNIMWIYIFLFT